MFSSNSHAHYFLILIYFLSHMFNCLQLFLFSPVGLSPIFSFTLSPWLSCIQSQFPCQSALRTCFLVALNQLQLTSSPPPPPKKTYSPLFLDSFALSLSLSIKTYEAFGTKPCHYRGLGLCFKEIKEEIEREGTNLMTQTTQKTPLFWPKWCSVDQNGVVLMFKGSRILTG